MKKLIVVLFLSSFSSLFASHIPGGNITYQCTGNPNEYIITLDLYVTCPSTLGNSQFITAQNSCGLTNPNITLQQVGTQQEVSAICIGQSACSGGTLPGVLKYTYQATIILPDTCNSWTFIFEQCCRNASTNTNGGSGNSMYFQTIMNSQTATCDDSPYVTAQPTPFVCVGVPQSYCPGVIDPNGDSLYFELINPLGAGGVQITHPIPYSPTSPLQNFTFDSTTGCVTFNQPTVGNFVVTYLISAYDVAGNLTGSIIHDFQIQVISCSNAAPIPPIAGITLTSGDATQTSPNTIELCEGSSACFDVVFSDTNLTDTLSVDSALSNIFTTFPGATITTSGINPLTVSVCWTVPNGTQPQVVATLTVTDGVCPVQGEGTQTIIVNTIQSTVTNSDLTICGTEIAQLNASGGSIFNWTSISGDSINIGTNFSCNPCANPIATPSVTTTYMVTSNLIGSCDSIDTVTVFVIPDFTISTSQSDTNICLGETINFSSTPTPSGSYNYLWSPSYVMNDSSIFNPTGTFTTAGSNMIIVSVDKNGDCIKTDTLFVNVSSNFPPNITITPASDTICLGDSTQLNVNLGGTIPTSCGPSTTTNCSGTSVNTTIGVQTGANTSTSYPAPYGNWYKNAKHQFLYTAAELNAMGINAGKITKIAWKITQVNGTSTYYGYQISMGCTSDTTLTTWVTGLTQVLNPDSINIILGVNTHVLDVAYEWDGVSNLVVEVCYDNMSLAYTNNSITPWSTTTFNSSLYFRSDTQLACSATTYTSSTNRPLTQFTVCPAGTDPNSYNYVWTPSTGLSNPTINNPVASPSATTTYYVTVTDTLGGCIDSDTVTVIVNICTYVNEIGEAFEINIYPNPNTGNFTIEKPFNLKKQVEIKLLDVSSRLVIKKAIPIDKQKVNMDITKYSKGVYYLQLIIDGEVIVKQILKN